MSTLHGPLTAADEALHHQFSDTFAVAHSSDPSWTERVYCMAGAKDGSIILQFGLGRYLNRNVMDGYAAISRGATQWTVRASRALDPRPIDTDVGPLRYEIVEPLRAVRVILEASGAQPIAFDVTLHGVGPPWMERSVATRGYRRSLDALRYIQVGHATGWIEEAGQRHDVVGNDWFQVRDHSWGIRQNVGIPPADRPNEASIPEGMRYLFLWSPTLFTRPDGSQYQAFLSYWSVAGSRGIVALNNDIRVFQEDGPTLRAREAHPHFRFDPVTRQATGCTLDCVMADGSPRRFTIETVGSSRALVGPGLYYGYKGHYHGEYRGRLAVDGDRIDGTDAPELIPEVHQMRDAICRVTDEATGAVGWSAFLTEAVGRFPEFGLNDHHQR